MKFVCLTLGRGVVVVLVSDDPTSVPSSKISFRHIAPGRIVLARVGDGIVLYFGGLTRVTGLDVEPIGIVIVDESVKNLVSIGLFSSIDDATAAAAVAPAPTLSSEYDRSPFCGSGFDVVE